MTRYGDIVQDTILLRNGIYSKYVLQFCAYRWRQVKDVRQPRYDGNGGKRSLQSFPFKTSVARRHSQFPQYSLQGETGRWMFLPKEGHDQRHPRRPQVSTLVVLNFKDNRHFTTRHFKHTSKKWAKIMFQKLEQIPVP